MARRKDFSDDAVFNAWFRNFSRAIDKKFYPQGTNIYLRRKRTSNTAISVVDRLRKLPVDSVRLLLNVCLDDKEFHPELLRIYEKEMIEARTYPDSFASGLYQFYMNTARHIRKNEETDLFFSMVAFVEDQQIADQSGDECNVNYAFMDLLLQQSEFLKSDTLNCTRIVAGVTTDGLTTLEIDDPYPKTDLPMYELLIEDPERRQFDVQSVMESKYRQLGFPGIRTMDDYQILNTRSAIFIGNVNCMAGFINEYTYDMLPKTPLAIGTEPMCPPRLKASYSGNDTGKKPNTTAPTGAAVPVEQHLSTLVRHRRRTLPANGVRVTFTGSSFYKLLTIKEIYKYGDLFMLYCLSTREGDISGRYNIRTGNFVTPLDRTTPRPDEFIQAIRGLVLWAYAAVTCDDDFVRTTNESYHATIDDANAHIEIVSLGNRLQRSDGPEPTAQRQRDLEKYETKEVSLNGFIRRLPEGSTASEQARQRALDVGLDLLPGETYVQPFVRRSWVLRSRDEEV